MKDAFEKRRYVPTNFCGRVSVELDDPGYDNYRNLTLDGYKPVIFLNGIEQGNCLSADPSAGSVCRYRTMKGSLIAYNGSIQTETVKGEVVIRLERLSQSQGDGA